MLCLKETGNYLPARTDLLPYVGHGPETIHSDEKEELAEQFFAGTLDAQAADTDSAAAGGLLSFSGNSNKRQGPKSSSISIAVAARMTRCPFDAARCR